MNTDTPTHTTPKSNADVARGIIFDWEPEFLQVTEMAQPDFNNLGRAITAALSAKDAEWEQRVKGLREALEWYASREEWIGSFCVSAQARAALASLPQKEKDRGLEG